MPGMSDLSEKTTVYLEPAVKKFLQFKAVNEGRSVSEIINDEFEELLEDVEDLKEIEKRKGEPSVPFEEVLKDFGLTLDDIRSKV